MGKSLTKKQLAYLFAVIYKRQKGAPRSGGRPDASAAGIGVETFDTGDVTCEAIGKQMERLVKGSRKKWTPELVNASVDVVTVLGTPDTLYSELRRRETALPVMTRNLGGVYYGSSHEMGGQKRIYVNASGFQFALSHPKGSADYKFGMNLSEGTYNHELGHGIWYTMEELHWNVPREGTLEALQWSDAGRRKAVDAWRNVVEANHDHRLFAGSRGNDRWRISLYSLTNNREHFAEAFKMYNMRKGELKEKAPPLYTAIDRFHRAVLAASPSREAARSRRRRRK